MTEFSRAYEEGVVEQEPSVHRVLGAAAIRNSERMPSDYRELPAGFDFTGTGSVALTELALLMRTVKIGYGVTPDYLVEQFESFQARGLVSIETGVRESESGLLVGYGGLIFDTEGNGEMGDFVVRPDFQSRGIGKAIIDQRILQADSIGLRGIYIQSPEPTNTLKSFYASRGFVEQDYDGLYREAPGSP